MTNKKVKKEPVTGIFYAIITVQNPYSSGNRGIERSWCSNYQSEEMTRAEFNKMAKRITQNFAERKFFDTLKGGGRVTVFTDREKFIVAANKVDIYPKFND